MARGLFVGVAIGMLAGWLISDRPWTSILVRVSHGGRACLSGIGLRPSRN